jgi:hypothetical protein
VQSYLNNRSERLIEKLLLEKGVLHKQDPRFHRANR